MTFRLALLLSGCAAAALAGSDKIAKDLDGVPAGNTVAVIVQYAHTPGQADLDRLAGNGGRRMRTLPSVAGVAVNLPAASLAALASSPDVIYVTPDRQVHGAMDRTVPTVGADLALRYGYDGKGVAVAVIDSGIAGHADLQDPATGQSRVVYRESFVAAPAQDRHGHGTHVAGIIGGGGYASGGALRGIAPQALLVDLQALDENGAGTDSSVVAALERAVELKERFGIRVVNVSLGRPVHESYTRDPICRAAEAAWKAGLVVIVAAGNAGRYGFPGSGGYWTVTAPGNDPYVLTVGAMKSMGTPGRGDDLVASYSSRGPTSFDGVVKPDLVAPGNRVTAASAGPASALARQFPEAVVGLGSSQYLTLSGTSVAAAVASGAAALLLEKEPDLTPDLVKFRLMKAAGKSFPSTSILVDEVSGQVYRSQYDVFTIGAGYLDIPGALAEQTAASGPALSPLARFDGESGQVWVSLDAASVWMRAGGLSAAWGSSVFLPAGNSAAWGGSAAGNRQVWDKPGGWSSSPVWGASAEWGNSVAWGASAAWGSSVAWGTSLAPLREK